MALTLEYIDRLYREHGHLPYGSANVTHLQHALQTATLAEEAGAAPALITASLLHDLGHLLAMQPDAAMLRDADRKHQYFVLPFLRGLFEQNVLEPIRLHVEAKRYLRFVEPSYAPSLPTSAADTTPLDGAAFDATQAVEFAAMPWAPDAIRLRRWDDQAREPRGTTETMAHFLAVADSVARRGAGTVRLGSKPRTTQPPFADPLAVGPLPFRDGTRRVADPFAPRSWI